MVLIQIPSEQAAESPASSVPAARSRPKGSSAEMLTRASRSFEQIDVLLDSTVPTVEDIPTPTGDSERTAQGKNSSDSAGTTVAPTAARPRRRLATTVIWAGLGGLAGSLAALSFFPAVTNPPGNHSPRPTLASPAKNEFSPTPPSTSSEAARRTAKVVVPELDPPSPSSQTKEPSVERDPPNSASVTPRSLDGIPARRRAFEVDPSLFADVTSITPARVQIISKGTSLPASDRLTQDVERLQLQDVSLGEFLQLIEQMSGAMLSVDPTALQMARIDLNSKVSVNLQATQIGNVLAQGLRPLYLGYRVEGTAVRILHLAVLHGHPPELELPVGDLLDAGWTEPSLLKTVQQLVEPQYWEQRPDRRLKIRNRALFVREPPAIQFQALVLLERLRMASHLPTQSVYGRVLTEQKPLLAQGETLGQRRVFVHGGKGIGFAEWLRELELQARCHLLPDWLELEKKEINGNCRLRFTADAMPLADALRVILAPLGLTYQSLSEDTYWITSTERELRTFVIQVHDLRPLLELSQVSPGALLEGVRAALISSLGQDGQQLDMQESRLTLDPSETLLLARLPQSQQLRLARGLLHLSQAGEARNATSAVDVHSAWLSHRFFLALTQAPTTPRPSAGTIPALTTQVTQAGIP